MSCVLELLSLNELLKRKDFLNKELKKVECQIKKYMNLNDSNNNLENIESSDNLETIDITTNLQTIESTDNLKIIESSNNLETIDITTNLQTIESTDNLKVIESSNNLQTIESTDNLESFQLNIKKNINIKLKKQNDKLSIIPDIKKIILDKKSVIKKIKIKINI